MVNFNLSIALYLFGTFVLFFLFYRFNSLHKRKQNRFAGLFKMMVLFGGLGILIYSLFFIFFATNSFYIFTGNIIGEPFILVAFVYGLAISFSILKPHIPSRKIIMPLAILAVFLSVFSHLKFPFAPFIDKDGVLHWNAHFIPGFIYSFFSLLGLLPLAIAFMWQSRKNKEIRKRSFFLAVGTILMLIAGIILSLAKDKNLYFLALLVQNFGFILFLVASFVRVEGEL